jgi:hypothetical protein
MSVAGIKTPRGEIFTVRHKNGSTTSRIKWVEGLGNGLIASFDSAQIRLDQEILRGCSKYVAKRTGVLEKSGALGTTPGSGMIRWIAPYAHDVYYRHYTGSNGDPLRGGQWFPRWKAAHGRAVIENFKKVWKSL